MSTELTKIFIAAIILSSVLGALGAATWLQVLCCMGMGFFWIGKPDEPEQTR